MIALVTVLVAFPAGFFVRRWLAANVVYIAAYAWAFSFQGFYLMLGVLEGDRSTATPGEWPWDYGVVALGIYLVGFGLVALGHRVSTRRRTPALDSPSQQEVNR